MGNLLAAKRNEAFVVMVGQSRNILSRIRQQYFILTLEARIFDLKSH